MYKIMKRKKKKLIQIMKMQHGIKFINKILKIIKLKMIKIFKKKACKTKKILRRFKINKKIKKIYKIQINSISIQIRKIKNGIS